jgi:hypothetical protein
MLTGKRAFKQDSPGMTLTADPRWLRCRTTFAPIPRFLSKNPSCWQAQDFRTCCRLALVLGVPRRDERVDWLTEASDKTLSGISGRGVQGV